MQKLTEVRERFRDVDDFELSELTHAFPAWVKHYNGGSSPIPWEDLLTAQKKPEMIAVVERDEMARHVFDDVFGPEP